MGKAFPESEKVFVILEKLNVTPCVKKLFKISQNNKHKFSIRPPKLLLTLRMSFLNSKISLMPLIGFSMRKKAPRKL